MFILNMLRRLIVHQFHNTSETARIRGKWKVTDNRWLKEDGANLASFLYRLQAEQPEHYTRIVDTIRLVLPFFATLELYPGIRRYPAALAGNRLRPGVRRIAGLGRHVARHRADRLAAAARARPARRADPEQPGLGLHPYAIEVLAGLLHSASRHVQIVVATQSASLIDRFDAADIVVVDRRGSATSFRRLDDAVLADWLKDYTLSELWEKNVVGGRPSR